MEMETEWDAQWRPDIILSDRSRRVNGMQHGSQVILSYLSGIAPIGTPIRVRREQISRDCEFGCVRAFHNRLNDLIARGLVRRIASGSRREPGALIVLKHYEEWKREVVDHG